MTGITLRQGEFEEANNVNATLYGHLNANLGENYIDLANRNWNVLQLYKKPMISWKLECDNGSSTGFTRYEAYDALYNKELNT